MEVILSFLVIRDTLPKQADVLMLFGSNDLLVPQCAANVLNKVEIGWVLVCGGYGRLTGELQEPEAMVYRDILLKNGVPEKKIIIEKESTNSAENIRFGFKKLEELEISPRNIILVQTPVLQRRIYLTFRKELPDVKEVINYAPYLPVLDDPRSFSRSMELALGEIKRLQEYGPQGSNFIIEPDLPEYVLVAYEELLKNNR